MNRTFATLLLAAATAFAHADGLWKAYAAYTEVTEVEEAAGNIVYVLASNGLYAYNRNDQSLQTFDKTTVLSDCDIAHISWNQRARRLVIVYRNGNIDLLERNSNVINIGDYYNKSMTEDKTINDISMAGAYAYISTGFGIIKLNVADGEISDTYNLGFNVGYSYQHADSLYAASPTAGLYAAALADNLLDKASWSRVGEYKARQKTIPQDLLSLVATLRPGGPKYNYFGYMKFYNGKLYTCGGGYNNSQLNRPGCIQVWNDNQWQIYQDDIATPDHEYRDLMQVAIDPKDNNHVFAGGRTGVYEFNNGEFAKAWSLDNSPLQQAENYGKNYVITKGLTFDNNGNLWVLNSNNRSQSILEYDGITWSSHHQSVLTQNGATLHDLQGLMQDSRGLLWFVNNDWRVPSMYAYQPSTNAINAYTTFVNEDGATVSVIYARCVAEDRNGNIWLGTDAGPLLLEQGQITATQPVFQQPKVPRNDDTNLADYLLAGVDISCIYVDQANRKWFGTNGSGIYLIAADNISQIAHYTTDNSPLLSNDIESLAMNPATGELFIGTMNGLCSYMTDATTASDKMTKDNVWAYPNPVKPGYTGPITITGLQDGADVKIVTSNGTLVNQGKASGNTYKWYGQNQKSERVASGVYFVQIATAEGEKGTVCKIAVVN